MRFIRKLAAVVLIGAMALFFLPGTASAELPDLTPLGVPPEVQAALEELYAQLPPEAQQAIDDALASVFAGLVPPVSGIGNESVTPATLTTFGGANASVVDVPGVVTVGKSETTTTSSKVTLVNVLGTDVLTKEGNATGGTYGGEGAALGALIDQVNTALCPGGVPSHPIFSFPAPTGTCLALMTSRATVTSSPTGSTRNTGAASFYLAYVHTDALADQGLQGLAVGFTSASSQRRTATASSPSPTGFRCINSAQSILFAGRGLLVLPLSILHPGGPLAALSPTSSTQPCPTP